jgi:hypothetical protein
MMKQLPTDDDVLGKGLVRPDGRKIRTTYLFEAKKLADIARGRGITSSSPRRYRRNDRSAR